VAAAPQTNAVAGSAARVRSAVRWRRPGAGWTVRLSCWAASSRGCTGLDVACAAAPPLPRSSMRSSPWSR